MTVRYALFTNVQSLTLQSLRMFVVVGDRWRPGRTRTKMAEELDRVRISAAELRAEASTLVTRRENVKGKKYILHDYY